MKLTKKSYNHIIGVGAATSDFSHFCCLGWFTKFILFLLVRLILTNNEGPDQSFCNGQTDLGGLCLNMLKRNTCSYLD